MLIFFSVSAYIHASYSIFPSSDSSLLLSSWYKPLFFWSIPGPNVVSPLQQGRWTYDDGYIDSTAYYDTFFKTLPSQRVILHRSGEQVKPRLTPHDGRSGAVGGGIRTHDLLIMSHSPYWFGHRRSSSQILCDIDTFNESLLYINMLNFITTDLETLLMWYHL